MDVDRPGVNVVRPGLYAVRPGGTTRAVTADRRRRGGWQPLPAREAAWAATLSGLRREGHRRLLLLGAGAHTRWLLGEGGPLGGDEFVVTAVLDDRPPPGGEVAGVRVLPFDAPADGRGDAAVALPSSDAHESALLARYADCRVAGGAVPCRPVYTATAGTGGRSFDGSRCLLPSPGSATNAPPAACDPAGRIARTPAWCSGHIGAIEAAFLTHLVAEVRPEVCVEIGVAAGVSSGILAAAVGEHGPPGAAVRGFDIDTHCYFERGRRVGEAAAAVAPDHLRRLEIFTPADAGDAAALHTPGSVDLAFIDGDHRHPAATLDLLELLPVLRPGAWVALHDVEPEAVVHDGTEAMEGPARLFGAWPFEKRQAAGPTPAERNIGAIRLPDDRREARPVLDRLLAESGGEP